MHAWNSLLGNGSRTARQRQRAGGFRANATLVAAQNRIPLAYSGELQPTEIMSDTGAYPDTRLADMSGTRFWRVDSKTDYGALDGLARQRINVALSIQHREDLLRRRINLPILQQALHAVRTFTPMTPEQRRQLLDGTNKNPQWLG